MYQYGGGGGYGNYMGSSNVKDMIKECLSSPIAPKDDRSKYFLISVKWMIRWKQYVNYDAEGPDTRPKDVR
jgi:hypothetical protein